MSRLRQILATAPVCVSAVVLGACGGSDGPESSRAPSSPRPVPNAALRVAATGAPITTGGTPVALASGFGAVWVADQGGGTVQRIGIATRRRTGPPIAVGPAPVAIAIGEGAVWVAGADGAVRSIDPATNRLQGRPVRVAGAGALAAGLGGVWVSSRITGTLTRIDPDTRATDAPIRVGPGAADVAIAGGAVWVANASTGGLSRVDPRTRRAAPPVPTGGGALLALASGDSGLWGARATGHFLDRVQVVRLDITSGKVIGGPVTVSGGVPVALAVAGRAVWVTDVGGVRPPGPSRPGLVTRIDARTQTVDRRPLRVGRRPSAVTTSAGAAWVANTADGTVTPVAARR